MDLVGHSVALFPASTPQEFLGFLKALGGGSSAIGAYVASHPAAAKFVEAPKPAPASFAALSYYYINAFKFINAKGESHFVRYEMRSVAPVASLNPQQTKQQSSMYLMDEIRKRLARRPVEFDYVAQIAEPNDPTNDATKVWPADRKTITLGRLTITRVVPDSDAAQRKLLFDPARITHGIELSSDPLILARSQAYAISFAKRQ
ncbi:MAG: catalase [Vulcanimicrobiaceae bacterium]